MYRLWNGSLAMMGRTVGVNTVGVLKWVGRVVLKLHGPQTPGQSSPILIDEMWHCVNGKKQSLVLESH